MKNILLISPRFFGYEQEIKDACIDLGNYCEWVDDRPGNSFLVKLLLRLNLKKMLFLPMLLHHYHLKKIIHKNNYDMIIIINPEGTTAGFIEAIRSISSAAIVTYFWDSIANKPNFLSLLGVADKSYSFDFCDCQTYKLDYRPLFYIESFSSLFSKSKESVFDISFIGTLHSGRYLIVEEAINIIKKKYFGLRFFTYFYCPSVVLFFFKKYITREFRKVPWSRVKFRPLSLHDTAAVLQKSSFTIDIPHSRQRGLTMRTFEACAAKCAILGSMENSAKAEMPWIMYEDITQMEQLDVKSLMIQSRCNYDYDQIKKYSVKNWLESIIDGSDIG